MTFPDQAQPNAAPLTFEEPRVYPHAYLPLPADASRSSEPSSDRPAALPPRAQRNPAPISETEVAAMHEFLASFDGDFGALFTPEKRNRLDD